MIKIPQFTKVSQNFETQANGIFFNRNLLWWYGDFLVLSGIIFWLIAFLPDILIPWLDWFNPASLSFTAYGISTIQFIFALTGAVIIGWGISIMAISQHYSRETRLYFILGISCWFLFDSIASLFFGFYLNMAFNLLFLAFGVIIGYMTPTIEMNPSNKIQREREKS